MSNVNMVEDSFGVGPHERVEKIRLQRVNFIFWPLVDGPDGRLICAERGDDEGMGSRYEKNPNL